jgi:hypothetical protein
MTNLTLQQGARQLLATARGGGYVGLKAKEVFNLAIWGFLS